MDFAGIYYYELLKEKRNCLLNLIYHVSEERLEQIAQK